MNIVFPQTNTSDTGDRLGFALVLAAVVHVLIIFGIGFQFHKSARPSPTLEVTLAQNLSKEVPEEADFLAQNNQLGSGDQAKKRELTTDQTPDILDSRLRDIQPVALPTPPPASPEAMNVAVTTISKSDRAIHLDRELNEGDPAPDTTPLPPTLAEEFASLRAKLDFKQREYSKLPRVLRLTSASTKAAEHAAYLRYWVDLVEQVGNRNYPEEARRRQIFGDLRLAVILLPDGRVNGVEILQSSGHRVLDLAAVRVVRMAAPFAPFPPEMRDWDRIEIIRTWRFIPGHQLQTD